MKRIINGVTYNTDTATVIARGERVDPAWGGNPEERLQFTLYQTRGGGFFEHARTVWEVLNRRTEEPEERERNEFTPKTRDEAQEWILEGDVELLNDVFGEPPEASEEIASPGATLYIRVPVSLKDRIEALARDEDLSLNAWVMRCVERCADMRKVGEALGEIIATGEASDSADSGAYTERQAWAMVGHMSQQATKAAQLLGWHGKELESLSGEGVIGYNEHETWPWHEAEGEEFREQERKRLRLEDAREVLKEAAAGTPEEQRRASRASGLTQTIEAMGRHQRPVWAGAINSPPTLPELHDGPITVVVQRRED